MEVEDAVHIMVTLAAVPTVSAKLIVDVATPAAEEVCCAAYSLEEEPNVLIQGSVIGNLNVVEDTVVETSRDASLVLLESSARTLPVTADTIGTLHTTRTNGEDVALNPELHAGYNKDGDNVSLVDTDLDVQQTMIHK